MSLGAGNRDDRGGCDPRGCNEPVEVLTVLALAFEPTERPELYDFLLMSGVVRAEEGVADAFLGIMDGDLESGRTSPDMGKGTFVR